MGIGKIGGYAINASGDIFIDFSTANENDFQRYEFSNVDVLPNDLIGPLFEATVQSVEEAIINALIAAETMEGINGNKSYVLPHDLLIKTLKKYNRLNDQLGTAYGIVPLFYLLILSIQFSRLGKS